MEYNRTVKYVIIGNLHVRLTFNLGKANKIFYYSYKEHPKISSIAKFGGEMLQNMENIASQSLKICIYLYYAMKKLPLLSRNCGKNGNFFLA